MARFISDLVQEGKTGVTVFYDGANPAHRAEVARYRKLAERRGSKGPADDAIRWKSIQSAPRALTLFGVSDASALQTLWLVDRRARLRRGLDARIKLWAELPGWRWLAWAATGSGLKALVARPVRPPHRTPHRQVAGR